MLFFAARGRGRRAVQWLVGALLLYAGWATRLDAAVHGWDDLKLL